MEWLERIRPAASAPGAQVAAACLIPVIGLVELAALLVQPPLSFSAVQPQELRAAFASLYHPGDAVVGTPESRSLPLVAILGDAASLQTAVFADPSRFERAIEVGFSPGSPQLGGWSLIQRQQVGQVHLRLWRNPEPLPLRYDFVSAVARAADAAVSVGPAGGAGTACKQPGGNEAPLPAGSAVPWAPRNRFSCGSDPLEFVGIVVLEDVSGRTRRCIWTLPATNAVRVSYPTVPAIATIRVAVGVPAGSGQQRAAVRVKANGSEIGHVEVKRSPAFEPHDFPAPMLGKGGEVTFEVEQLAESRVPVCLEASAR